MTFEEHVLTIAAEWKVRCSYCSCKTAGVIQNDMVIFYDGTMFITSAVPHVAVQRNESVERESYHINERRTGHVTRSLRLPRDADEESVRAQYTDGVLRICLDKKIPGEGMMKSICITEDYPFAK